MLDKRFRKIILLLRSNGGPTCAQLVCVVLVLDYEVQTDPRIHLVLAFGPVSNSVQLFSQYLFLSLNTVAHFAELIGQFNCIHSLF